jgi:hypothetical protein
MNHILSLIKKEGIECLPCDRINLDLERFSEDWWTHYVIKIQMMLMS